MGQWIKGYLVGWGVIIIICLVFGYYATMGLAWLFEWVAVRAGYFRGSVIDAGMLVAIIGGSLWGERKGKDWWT
jgi:hypothetical protein